MRPALLGGLVVIGAGVVAAYRAGIVPEGVGAAVGGAVDSLEEGAGAVLDTVKGAIGLWAPPEKYAAAIQDAESANGLPFGLLARLLWTESRYRADAVNPKSGALGIAQFMPATARELGIDPMDPFQAIPAAGRYLANLYRLAGTWAGTLAAYNWGIGNLQRLGLEKAPAETRNYYTSILGAVGLA